MAGLLELADVEFETLRDYDLRLKAEIEERIVKGDLSLELDPASLTIFLRIRGLRTKQGSPISGRVVYELIEECQAVRIRTVGDLEKALIDFPEEEWRSVIRDFEYEQRAGIGRIRDVLKYHSPQAYYDFAREHRQDWDIPRIRLLCERLEKIRRTKRGGMNEETN